MIRHVQHAAIDFEKWDQCISQAPNGILYAFSWYLDMVSPGWSALVEDDYHAVMPLPSKTKWGIQHLYQPLFAQQLGVFSTGILSADLTKRFVEAIPSRYRYIDICLNTFNGMAAPAGYQWRNMITYEKDLAGDYDMLKSTYSTNTLRNVKKAVESGVFVTPHGKPEDIIDTFRKHRGKDIHALGDEAYTVLKHLIYAGIHRGMVEIYTAYTGQNTFCAGVVFYRSHQKSILLFSGADQSAKELGAMFLLVDTYIRDHAGLPLVLDFEGSMHPGLARFYRGFGSKECVFLQLKMNRLPRLVRPVSYLYLWYKQRKARQSY